MMKHLWLLLWLTGSCLTNYATTIRVSPGKDALRTAIGKALPGDTLLVLKGIYQEHDINITRTITILGSGMPVIDASSKYPGLLITADSVVIQGIQVQRTGRSSISDIAGIRISNAKNVVLRNNRMLDCTYGIYLQNAHNCTILNNTVHTGIKNEINGGNGIHAWKCDRLQISGNSVSGHRDGIYFEFVTDSKIDNNISYANQRYGLHFMFSHQDSYTKNTFRENGAGVAVMYTRGVTMYDNTFVQNWGDASYGLLLKEITDSKIEHNRFIKNTIGIHMEGTTRVDVLHNLFQDNGWALRVMASSSGSRFTENNFISNSFDVATNGTLMLNEFRRNYWDKYDGYDLDRDHIGDVPHYPVSVYAVISEKIPAAMILYRSFLTGIMEQVEKVMPSMIPDQLRDDSPMMKKIEL
ncbi:nitrous oxide reductase family maturation protein NosD [Chitinophaga sp. HK235]|uniref:nitrous oxide reductase family maturation protein NosD n=1 Tax=Chitinophaga sp. HK235 TaxID=2952571 RepID=UPI002011C2AA|nr:nitrous oxide reductase family maturation protein NosD [Chitinophaga sp. HK235]